MNAAFEALERLREGNRRFVLGTRRLDALVGQTPPTGDSSVQRPFAIVLGCSDSRVPVELVFDQGPGDLFVIRVAGNIVAPSQIGSAEFAAEQFGPRLIVVLGHTECGAVRATLEELQRPAARPSKGLGSIVDRIRPAVEGLLATELRNDPGALMRQAVRSNVRMSAQTLRYGSGILEQLIRDEGLLIVGAEYSLQTGCVDFFDGVSASG